MFICDRCVESALKKLESMPSTSSTSAPGIEPLTRLKCDFCGEPVGRVAYILKGEHANICDDCLRLSRRILDGDAT
jgi:hypothetical protein